MNNLLVGWREWVALPRLGLPAIKAKIDTGARSSSLHAFRVELFGPNDKPRIRFGVHPVEGRNDIAVFCTANVHDKRQIMSSNGQSELRYIIRTQVQIGDQVWPIEISLSNREAMMHRMLLGRTALEAKEFIVQPWAEYRQPELSFSVYDSIKSQPPLRRSLRIALLTMEPENSSNQRLIAAAETRDHVIDILKTTACYMDISSLGSAVHLDGQPLPYYDAVIPRIGASITAYGAALVRQFEVTGTYCLNSATGITNSRDKLLAHQIMARQKLPMPVTAFASSPESTKDLIEMVGGPPLVVKLLHSTQGSGVGLAHDRTSAVSMINMLRNLTNDFLVQEFIAEAKGQDIRCIVLNGEIIAAMQRKANGDDFRSNLHQGGTASMVELSNKERKVAIKAARIMGLNFAGVDILRSEKGPLVLEVNSSPGLEGIERTTGANVAAKIIEAIAARACKPHWKAPKSAVKAAAQREEKAADPHPLS